MPHDRPITVARVHGAHRGVDARLNSMIMRPIHMQQLTTHHAYAVPHILHADGMMQFTDVRRVSARRNKQESVDGILVFV